MEQIQNNHNNQNNESFSLTDNQMYSVNLKDEAFQRSFNLISNIFEGVDYLTLIRKINDPILKDIFILMRKYQYYLTLFEFNGEKFLEALNSLSKPFVGLRELLSSEENIFKLSIRLIPSFKKNELDFILPNDELKLNITINVDRNFKPIASKCRVEIQNFLFSPDTNEKYNQIVTKVFQGYCTEFDGLQGVNKFLTYLQNYFPQINLNTINNHNAHPWTDEEQIKLEEGLICYQTKSNSKERFHHLQEAVGTKSIREVAKRYKELITCESKLLKGINWSLFQDEKKKCDKKTEVIAEVIETPMERADTLDLVDEIMSQFNNLYSNVTFSKEDEEEPQEEFEFDEDHSENELNEDNINNPSQKDEQNEENDINLNRMNILNLSTKDASLIRNILQLGDRYSIYLTNLQMMNVGIAETTDINVMMTCTKCSKVSFESKFQKLSKKLNMFYLGTKCPKCRNEIFAIFNSELLHQDNLVNAGTAFCIGTSIIDILPSKYTLSCVDCPDVLKTVKLKSGSLEYKNRTCSQCQKEIIFNIYSTNVVKTKAVQCYLPDDLSVVNFSRINMEIDYVKEGYVKKYDRPIQVGNPLPEQGTCRHYKLSYRWFRFSCCCRVFPCDECHNEANGHLAEFAKQILCGHCAFEQSSGNKVCCHCAKSFTKIESANGFWEGGKGCRDKTFMSSKDAHKFTNSKLKTISRKKMAELNTKK